MKKMLWFAAASIISAFGLSSYESIHRWPIYYWFEVKSATNDTPVIFDIQSTIASTVFGCTGVGAYYCENAYTENQVEKVNGTYVVKTNGSGVYESPIVISKSYVDHY